MPPTHYLKASLHCHCYEDPTDRLPYCSYELIKTAAKKGFEVLAITCHKKIFWNKNLQKFAQKHNILLIPGIEAKIEGKHVLILNALPETEKLKTFTDLKKYRQTHPECLIIAPHPFFIAPPCLGQKLLQHADLFDAIEYSHYYCPQINRNKKAAQIAKKLHKPIIGTSDLHFLCDLEKTYALIQAEKNIPSILKAIRQNHVKLVTHPRIFLELPFYHFKGLWTFLRCLPFRFKFFRPKHRCPFCKHSWQKTKTPN